MLRHFCWSVVALVGLVTTAAAQATSGVSGRWNCTGMVGANDSVLIIFVLTIAPDGQSATIRFVNQNPVPTRILAMAGDSMVAEAGPYQSVLRPWESVKSLRTVSHFKRDAMWGTFEALYASGDIVKGRTVATRVK